jgi:hypothetical protein
MTQEPATANDWDNGELVLYHGTDSGSADSIRKGIDLKACREGRDFGRGFYTTTSYRQAEVWARDKARQRSRNFGAVEPVVLVFHVDRNMLARLESLWFIRGTSADYWSFIDHCRGADETKHGRAGCYDVVAGPVSRATPFPRTILRDSDQVSFHTEAALEILGLPS